MTLIEFFEKDAIENICSSLAKAPERVILLGDKLKLMQRHAECYKTVLAARGVFSEFICRTVNKNKMQTVIDALSEIVENYDDCVFDLTGGEDFYLVAAGIVFERYRDRNIQMHRFNIRNGAVLDGDQDGHTITENDAPSISIEENIRIYGGDIVYDDGRKDATYRWDMNDDFKNDINNMWDICRRDVRLWNAQIGVLEFADRLSGSFDDNLTVSIPADYLKEELERSGGRFVAIIRILDGLYRCGILTSYRCDDDLFSVTYKNTQVRRCLTVAGKVLEMKIFLAALDAYDKNGERTYNDVMNGVFIDWDGEIGAEESFDTVNEIDVMMMHGMVPVFVSCKNGYIDKEELYKLNTVAARFGGKYAKKVLIATALDDSVTSDHIRQRAEDMEIRLAEGFSCGGIYKDIKEMNDDELNRAVRQLWSN